jgi:hypothetical protein
MSRKIEAGYKRSKQMGKPAIAMLLAVISLQANADVTTTTSDQAEPRSSESLNFANGGRANMRDPQKGNLSVDQYAPLNADGARSKTVSKTSASKTVDSASQSGSYDFWIFDADVVLFYDDDGDGYFYGIDLLFDADTIYSSADVYAAVYLSFEGGPWNEYAVTDDFTLFGASGDDEYVLVTELMSGYPTGDYDLLIELFDAYDGAFVASFGPDDTSEFAYLPLEDFNRDAPDVEQRIVIVSEGGGGAIGIWLLIGLLGLRMVVRPSR